MKPALIIIGLGNPGKEYAGTRHNVGFWAIDALAAEFGEGEWKANQKFLGDTLEGRIVTAPLFFLKPGTFMNRSGEAAKKNLSYYKLPPTQLLVLCDDIDLPVGEIRLRESGGAGSHNGLKSVAEQIGENFPRVRIGILGSDAPRGSFLKAGMDLSTYVLSKPSASEKKRIEQSIKEIPGMVREFVMGNAKA